MSLSGHSKHCALAINPARLDVDPEEFKHEFCDGQLLPGSASKCACQCHAMSPRCEIGHHSLCDYDLAKCHCHCHNVPPTAEEVNAVTKKLLAMTLELNRIEDTMEDAW